MQGMCHNTVAFVAEGHSKYIERDERVHDHQSFEEEKCSKAIHVWCTPVVELKEKKTNFIIL